MKQAAEPPMTLGNMRHLGVQINHGHPAAERNQRLFYTYRSLDIGSVRLCTFPDVVAGAAGGHGQ
jgi:hypothetical protein